MTTNIICNKCNEPKTLEQIKFKNVKRIDGTSWRKQLLCCKKCYRVYYSGKYPTGTTHVDIGWENRENRKRTTKQRLDALHDSESIEKARATKRKHKKSYEMRGKELIYSILKDAKCVDCGYDNWLALEFDHLPEHVKKYDISQMYTKSLKAIQTEIDKCDIVCSNCHTIRSFTRAQSWRVQMG